MHNKIDVFPPHGFVKLTGFTGEEIDIVNAARVSFHNESEKLPISTLYPSGLNEKDQGLIKFLLKNKHGSPFEQGFMARFHIRLPIFVMREWVRHRIGFSVNEESGRYVEMRPDFYIPEQLRTQKGKPGAYYFDKWEPNSSGEFNGEEWKSYIEDINRRAFEAYKDMLDAGIAKEQARIVLPLNLYTEIRWSCNARSLMNFLALRNSEHAMFEIKQYALALEDIFKQHMPIVYKAFLEAERVAP